MFKTVKFRGRLTTVFALLCAGVFVAACFFSLRSGTDTVKIGGDDYPVTVSGEADVIGFLNDLGYSAEKIFEREVTVPEIPNEVYSRYIEMQKKSGFSLGSHLGEPATLSVYKTADSEQYINILTANGRIIAAHISPMNGSGEMRALTENEK